MLVGEVNPRPFVFDHESVLGLPSEVQGQLVSVRIAELQAESQSLVLAIERRAAWSLLRSALYPDKMGKYIIKLACYGHRGWENYTFVAPENLRVALVMAAAVA